MSDDASPTIERFPAEKQRRLDDLLERNSQSAITEDESQELRGLVADVEALMIANAKRFASDTARDSTGGADRCNRPGIRHELANAPVCAQNSDPRGLDFLGDDVVDRLFPAKNFFKRQMTTKTKHNPSLIGYLDECPRPACRANSR